MQISRFRNQQLVEPASYGSCRDVFRTPIPCQNIINTILWKSWKFERKILAELFAGLKSLRYFFTDTHGMHLPILGWCRPQIMIFVKFTESVCAYGYFNLILWRCFWEKWTIQIRSFSEHQKILETENFEKSYSCSKLVKKSKIQGNRGIHNPFTKESNQKLSQIRKTIENPLKIGNFLGVFFV